MTNTQNTATKWTRGDRVTNRFSGYSYTVQGCSETTVVVADYRDGFVFYGHPDDYIRER